MFLETVLLLEELGPGYPRGDPALQKKHMRVVCPCTTGVRDWGLRGLTLSTLFCFILLVWVCLLV